jgi:predicted acylesterase/phospholipase RssA
MATCAAPPFFDSVTIQGLCYADGAFQANNPVFLLSDEARELWVNPFNNERQDLQSQVGCILSIGTGEPGVHTIGATLPDLLKTLNRLVSKTTEISKNFMDEWTEPRKEGRAFRLNVQQGLDDVGLAEFNASGKIMQRTENYLEQPETKDVFIKCVQSLFEDGMSAVEPILPVAERLRAAKAITHVGS